MVSKEWIHSFHQSDIANEQTCVTNSANRMGWKGCPVTSEVRPCKAQFLEGSLAMPAWKDCCSLPFRLHPQTPQGSLGLVLRWSVPAEPVPSHQAHLQANEEDTSRAVAPAVPDIPMQRIAIPTGHFLSFPPMSSRSNTVVAIGSSKCGVVCFTAMDNGNRCCGRAPHGARML